MSDLIVGRFAPEAPLGSGGMGVVYRARDNVTGEQVAVKLMRAPDSPLAARFQREAQILSEFTHPAIVRTVAFGVTPDGEQYLAMEWLEGLDLKARLATGPLAVPETIALGRRIASALAYAHAQGVIHRDIKPSNIFLPGGDIERAKLLDFGVARLLRDSSLTTTGTLVGTPAYMSPEQCRDAHEVDERSDLFSLGCVLAECVTGKRLFNGPSAEQLMAMILFEDTEVLAAACAAQSAELGALVRQLLAKDRAHRPESASEVERILGEIALGDRIRSVVAPQHLSRDEQSLVAVVTTLRTDPAMEATLVSQPTGERPELEIVKEARALGAVAERTPTGTVISVFRRAPSEEAKDLCARAALLALFSRSLLPGRPTAIVTGKAVFVGHVPIGQVNERAALLVRAAPQGGIAIDRVTRDLLDGRFVVGGSTEMPELIAQLDAGQSPATLMPWVGHEPDLAAVEAAWAGCVDEVRARRLVIVGPSGVGKSRLACEFVQRLGETAQIHWVRGEPEEVEPLGLVQRLICAMERDGITSALARQLLGEASLDAELAAAREHSERWATLYADCVEELAREHCRHAPLVWVIDDLQWVHSASLHIIGRAIERLAHERLLVLALARSETESNLPDMWSRGGARRLHLRPLARRPFERLIAHAIGADVDLERIRSWAVGLPGRLCHFAGEPPMDEDGSIDGVPAALLAVVQARMEELPDEGRRVLRAASVFGAVFPPEGVAMLLDLPVDSVRQWLDTLGARGMLVGNAFAGNLIETAAYASLTDADRRLGHRLAAQFLQAANGDAAVIAGHLERGHRLSEAAAFYSQAADMAAGAGDDMRAACWQRHTDACLATAEIVPSTHAPDKQDRGR